MKTNQLVVIELEDDSLKSVVTFSNGAEGVEEARTAFSALALQHGATGSEVVDFLRDAYYEAGTYQLFLAQS